MAENTEKTFAFETVPDAQESRSQPEGVYVTPVALAHHLVPWLEGVPATPGANQAFLKTSLNR